MNFLKAVFIYVLAVLGLHCCLRAFSHCGKQGLLPSCSAQASHCGRFSCCGEWALGTQASVAALHRLRCSEAYEILPDQEWNRCLLHWQADSSLLDHQGSPKNGLLM